MKTSLFIWASLGLGVLRSAPSLDLVHKITLPATGEMTRSDVYVRRTVNNPRAVLVLCPGFSGNGEGFLAAARWVGFAQKNGLGMAAISFASPQEFTNQNRGYYGTGISSGGYLLKAIRQSFDKPLPLLIYGFSGGAHFTSSFVENFPDQVTAWCAYSAAWWIEPKKMEADPPGIVACGDADPRYGASSVYFKQGRAAGKPWLWVSLAGKSHEEAPELEEFVREYFHAVLQKNPEDSTWVDIDRKMAIPGTEAVEFPSLSGWLPSKSLISSWKHLHAP